ncbi:MAG: WS/DGAT domain-containing protein [Acidimicrobiales bacterium]
MPVASDACARFEEVHQRLSVTKTERAMNVVSTMAGLVNLLPQPVLVRLARQQVTTVDFATSNVRAAPFDLYIAGALVTGNYPLGPIAGTAWNLTTMSYRGVLNLGLHVDRAAVSAPAELRDDIVEAFAELLALGGARGSGPATGGG